MFYLPETCFLLWEVYNQNLNKNTRYKSRIQVIRREDRYESGGLVSEFQNVFRKAVGKNHYFCALSLVHLLRIQKLVILGKEGDEKACMMISST